MAMEIFRCLSKTMGVVLMFIVNEKGLITNIINRAEIFNGFVELISSPGKGYSMHVNFSLEWRFSGEHYKGKERSRKNFMVPGHSHAHPMDGSALSSLSPAICP